MSNKTVILSDNPEVDKIENIPSPSKTNSNKTIILVDEVVDGPGNLNAKKHTTPLFKNRPFASGFFQNKRNLILGYATPIFSFVNRMRYVKDYDDSVYEKIIELMNDYIQKLRDSRIDAETLQSAIFILCMTIDEVALKSKWYHSSNWLKKGILDTFFQQSQDDGYFLNLIEYYFTHKRKNKDILEFFSICLSIGPRGNNNPEIAVKSENLRYKLLNAIKSSFAQKAPHFCADALPPAREKKAIKHRVPLWLIFFLSACLLISIYSGFRFALSLSAEPVSNRIAKIYTFNFNDDMKAK